MEGERPERGEIKHFQNFRITFTFLFLLGIIYGQYSAIKQMNLIIDVTRPGITLDQYAYQSSIHESDYQCANNTINLIVQNDIHM